MILGLSDRSNKGKRWRAMSVFSRVNDGLILLMW